VEIVFGVVALTAGLIAMFVAQNRKQQRTVMLRQLASSLGGRHTAIAAFGNRDGIGVRFEYTTRGTGKSKEYWTTVDASVLAVYPLALHVRRHRWFERDGVARGGVVDVPLGDEPFDEAFRVEAAPEEIARALLDARVRSALLGYDRVELDTVTIGDGKVLRLAIRGWIEDGLAAARAGSLRRGRRRRAGPDGRFAVPAGDRRAPLAQCLRRARRRGRDARRPARPARPAPSQDRRGSRRGGHRRDLDRLADRRVPDLRGPLSAIAARPETRQVGAAPSGSAAKLIRPRTAAWRADLGRPSGGL
jgi:hypothetical protein